MFNIWRRFRGHRHITQEHKKGFVHSDACNLCMRRPEEIASMEIDVPVTMDRNQWLTQQASESTIDKGKVIYITDQDNHWDAKRIPFPTGEDEDWVYIGQTLAPGYEIVDVHFTDVSAHVYIKRRKA